ncbi:hypothetical protein FQN50_002460 [Emmonsiellopsis sp. PD_5]|nr:hypothetical protein FQN50_002460 [Emmonsiellopsis sp. PD_5]
MSPPSTLKIKRHHSSLTGSGKYYITTPDGLWVLYTITTSSSHPELTITRHLNPIPYTEPPSTTAQLSSLFSSSSSHRRTHSNPSNDLVIATATFHTFSSKIDITLHNNQTFTMKRPDPFSSARRFNSLTPLGTLEWRSDGGVLGSLATSNMKLVDAGSQQRTFARYEKGKVGWSGRAEADTLMIVDDGGVGGFFDMVVISLLATVEYKRVEKSATEGVGDAAEAVAGV